MPPVQVIFVRLIKNLVDLFIPKAFLEQYIVIFWFIPYFQDFAWDFPVCPVFLIAAHSLLSGLFIPKGPHSKQIVFPELLLM